MINPFHQGKTQHFFSQSLLREERKCHLKTIAMKTGEKTMGWWKTPRLRIGQGCADARK